MKHYFPAYFQSFRCIAADCPDSCCRGWDVVIDSETEEFYHSVEGYFGDRIRRSIITDSDGDRVFRLAEEKKCPFWSEDKLCDIYRHLGEDHLCETCARFPRIKMEFADFCEYSLALACPEAARLILTTNDAYAPFTRMTSVGCADYDAETMELLLESREKCAGVLSVQKPLSERLKDCLAYSKEIQNLLYPLKVPAVSPYCFDDFGKLFDEMEYIEESSRNRIVQACRPAELSENESEMTCLALYYLYRYYLGAVDTFDVIAPISFMVVSLVIISNLSKTCGLPLAEAAQMYSKEIEQSYENMERLYEVFSYGLCFMDAVLPNLFIE